MARDGTQVRFHGAIAGLGSTSGVRIVVGRWASSPFGSFADVMLERADGRRLLLAPSPEVGDYVAALYGFDDVRVGSVTVAGSDEWTVDAPGLSARFALGPRTRIGRLLRLQPAPLAARPWWSTAVDPVARRVVRGVRTRGHAGGRDEFYGALDQHAIVSVSGSFDDADLGALAPVVPPVRFGFSSTPPQPSVTRVVTTVRG